jgi:hypothetical protein
VVRLLVAARSDHHLGSRKGEAADEDREPTEERLFGWR